MDILTPPTRELLEPDGIGLTVTHAENLASARRMAHIVTDRLTPWLEPYHPAGRPAEMD